MQEYDLEIDIIREESEMCILKNKNIQTKQKSNNDDIHQIKNVNAQSLDIQK